MQLQIFIIISNFTYSYIISSNSKKATEEESRCGDSSILKIYYKFVSVLE
jgi:hypothetical protein